MKNGLPSVSSCSAWQNDADGDRAGAHPDELDGLLLGETPDLDLRHESLAAKLRERVGEAVGAGLGRAVGAEHEHAPVVRRPRDVAQQQQRRAIRPLQIVEHEQHRRLGRHLAEQPDDGLEQPVALGLRLRLERRRQVGRAPAQLRNEPRELGAVLAGARPQLRERARSDT